MRRSFDWMAHPYAALERLMFGSTLHALRMALASALDTATDILILGEGDGRFLATLLLRNPEASVVVVEQSGPMIERARSRIAANSRVRFVQSDVITWLRQERHQEFDAVATLFFLDCFEGDEQRRIVTDVSLRLTPSGRWLWADFEVPERGLVRAPARLVVSLLYLAFRLTTNIRARRLQDPLPYLTKLGWQTEAQASRLFGVLQTRLLQRGVKPTSRS